MAVTGMRVVKALRYTLVATLFLFGVQFILGMLTNLYVNIPSLPGGDASKWVSQHSTLTNVHILTGTLLLLFTIAVLVMAAMLRRGNWTVLAIAGLLSTLVSWATGAAFLSDGQQNVMSLWMSLGFLLSILVYSILFAVTPRKAR
ncbi:hypothetical protein [Alicyclobacillus sp. ALC3]|uniref:hypothetical protein n=1 Tax=Alicyclobacillus sp. ALC3 TaxID=2796143 RepID=UPI0023784994|nr:hypothetical protein [Alicyclobacillus sp. ALC3]WDL99204.1 hypothetical protein JC200_11485 [Alicyclobacillus sp. ALC3]